MAIVDDPKLFTFPEGYLKLSCNKHLISIRGTRTLTPWALPIVLSPADKEMWHVQYGLPFLPADPEWSQGEQLQNRKLTLMERSLVLHLIWLTIYFGNTRDGFHMVFLNLTGFLPAESRTLRSNPGWGRKKKICHLAKRFIVLTLWSGNQPLLNPSISNCSSTLALLDLDWWMIL